MVLQGFAWEMLKKENERDSSMILYPTYGQSRFMAFNAIAHGATGILYWGTNYTPKDSPFIDDLNKVTKELAEMQPILSSPTIPISLDIKYHELMYSVDTGIELLAKRVNGKTYLITVNSDKNPVKVTFSGLNKYKKISVLNEKRKIDFLEGNFTDYYEPFGVHIYELKKTKKI
jgi:hypothetical protein